jgi:chemotaxis protein histidine kinase CheA
VIYQVQKAGEPQGDFTLNSSEQTPNGFWVGLGMFDSIAAQQKRKENATKRQAAAKAAKADEEKAEEGDRPVLRRSSKASAPPADSSKPTEQKTQGAPQATPASTAPASAASTEAASPKPQLADTDNAPGRPILRRGKPAQEQASSLADNTPQKQPVAPPAGMGKLEVAVSDATSHEAHPYQWTWKDAAEEQKLKAQSEKLAQTILADYAGKNNGPKPGVLLDVSFQAYDLTFSNAPTVIVSARAVPAPVKPAVRRTSKVANSRAPTAPPDFEYYVTVVGKEDIYGEMQKEFAVATDSKHLDAFPRMKLVDIVDADGNGAGDYLFQNTSDRGESFVIYRDYGWSLQEVIKVPAPQV